MGTGVRTIIQWPLQLPSMDKMRPKDGGAGPRMTPCWVGSWMTVFVFRVGEQREPAERNEAIQFEKCMYRRVLSNAVQSGYNSGRCCQKIRATFRKLAGQVRPRLAKRLNGRHSPLGFVICHATAGRAVWALGSHPRSRANQRVLHRGIRINP